MTAESLRIDEGFTNRGLVKHLGDIKKLLGLLWFQRREAFVEFVRRLINFRRSFVIESLSALYAERCVTLVFPTASEAFNRRNVLGFFLRNVDSMESCEFTIGIFSEDRDVSSCRAAPSHPAVVLFDVRLIEVPACQKGGTRLAEVSGSNRLGNIRAVGSFTKNFRDHPTGDRFCLGNLRPQRRVWVVSRWVCIKPSVDIRDRRNQQYGSTALLSFDSNFQPVIVIPNVPDTETFELAATEPSIKLQGDHCRVAGVVRSGYHGLHLLVVSEHISWIGRRVVIRRGACRNPFETLGEAVSRGIDTLVGLGDTLPEDTKGDSVIPVRFLVVVLGVDPRDNSLGRVAVVEGLGERTTVKSLQRSHSV